MLYSIITLNKLIDAINNLPTLREPCFKDASNIRHKIGQGLYLCKLLAQKSNNNEEAIELYNTKMNEIYGNKENNLN